MSFFQRYWTTRQGQQAGGSQTSDSACIDSSMYSNLNQVEAIFSGIPDLTIRELPLKTGEKALLVYLDGLIDKTIVNRDIVHPLLVAETVYPEQMESVLFVGKIKQINLWAEIEESLFHGCCIIFMDGFPHAFLIEAQGWPQRAIQEPQIESAIKSAHQGFIETANANISMIRRYIPSRELKVKEHTIGERGGAKVSLLYLADVTNPQILDELEKRLESLTVDIILNTGELEGYLEDRAFTPFPQFSMTERPDTAASHILQGRVVIVMDRSPGVLVAPMTFFSYFQTVDDYSVRWFVASFIRLLRFLAFFIAILAPAIYIATVSFHYELIPLPLLLTIGESRERVPLPPILEAFIMEMVLEMLREAGLRLPAPIGQTIGIVGGIVIGQAAVSAGLVSNIMVIVVALTAIASFIIPNLEMSAGVRMIRFPMMVAASLFGMVGIIWGLMLVILHLLSLESLGTPYGASFSPLHFSELKDTFVRLPMWMMKKRPIELKPKQVDRQGDDDGVNGGHHEKIE
ncbi:spore germination protein [Brevibacillus laterosporus]|uniref:spore germination protein n=1 Tax=Brevibacillus laterosporus TaxID=1465 RepID=UPI002656E3DE|nr:spore germination protein [Brevibacillus laterosporus]MDN9010375.1 spore germination protein [Brevibacillus laterosporus]MDO0941262.1 spore germination protein [Brevibacillus laterosporus]